MSFFNGEISIPGQTGGRLTLDASLNSSYTFTFPPDVGENNQLLKSNGTGAVGWTKDLSLNSVDVSNNLKVRSTIGAIDSYDAWDTSGNDGLTGGGISITSGSGGSSIDATSGGWGGQLSFTAGSGGSNFNNSSAGGAGSFYLTAGSGGSIYADTNFNLGTSGSGENGGNVDLYGGSGGSGYNAGSGGNITLTGGWAGSSNGGTSGSNGNIQLNSKTLITADISGQNIYPSATGSYDLGSNSNKWNVIHVEDVSSTNLKATSLTLTGNMSVLDISAQNIYPISNGSYNLGSGSNKWSNIYTFDVSTVNIDTNTLSATGISTMANVSVQDVSARNILPETNNTYALGSGSNKWSNLYIEDISAQNVVTYDLTVTGPSTLNVLGKSNLVDVSCQDITSQDISCQSILPITAGTYNIGSNTQTWNNMYSVDVSSTNMHVGDTLRIAQNGTGLRMTNVGAFDASGTDFRVFGTNNLILCANGDSNPGLTIDSTSSNVNLHNALHFNTLPAEMTFGPTNEITLTALQNGSEYGIRMNSTRRMYYRSVNNYIHSPSTGNLTARASTQVNTNIAGTNIFTVSAIKAAITATTESSTTSTGALTVAGGVGIAKDLSVGDDLRLLSDGAILSMGTNSEIEITHIHDEGISINNTSTPTDAKPVLKIIQPGNLSTNRVAFSGTEYFVPKHAQLHGNQTQSWMVYGWQFTTEGSGTGGLYFAHRTDTNSYADKGYVSSLGSGQMNFTGQHRSIMNIDISDSSVGLIVSSTGKYVNTDNTLEASINESLPVCEITTIDNDKKVFGVLSDKEDNETNREYSTGSFVSIMVKQNTNEQRMFINSVGEGGIWVCNKNGYLENGDYISSSSVVGYGMKQSNDILHNYTVAKITCDCDFTTTKIVKQKLKVIETTDTSGNTTTTIDYDINGNVQYEDDLDASGNQQMVYPLDTRFITSDGTQITEAEYNTKLSNGENVYIACFVGCTYHCG